ncbi:MAG: 1-(5-phosphoribosyl)-5-[(5-phosphoribosylamino)methylideneamino]imidazole-4-carboxamide isomerase [Candidatus Omnitrophica bacterium]|nr:1-(5-phosphoribosyl)-5-[(5-phosphoribosylamino)methylideneamino]imidazole-4-carboxamide isomerase [Candidatus Omnitrophota bacterium]
MKVIPAIDLIDGKTVRLLQGKYDKELNYDVSPVDAARRWRKMGAELLHIVDLDGARKGRPMNLATAEEISRSVDIPVELGGGFREKKDIRGALAGGVARVIIGSKALTDIDFARSCIEEFGEKVIISVDARNARPMISGWEKGMDIDLLDILKRFVSFGAQEMIFTDIEKDGMLSGPSTDLLEDLLSKVDVKLISAGGIKTVEHIKELKKLEPLGLSGAIVGRALYEGTIDLKEAINAG